MRVLVSGMGTELGTRVTLALEAQRVVTELVGIDVDPPRRRLRRAHFVRVDPRRREKVAAMVRDLRPEALVHLGVYEPGARSGPRSSSALTAAGTRSALAEAAASGSLERIVVRSGIEVYGRRRGAVTVPGEEVPPDPTSPFGEQLLGVERAAAAAGRAAGCPVAVLRLAPVVGAHVPHPLGRLLRLPVVPFDLLADPPFCLLHPEDAARAVVAALLDGVDGTVNVVGPGAVTALRAARLGGRLPLPVAGPGWIPACQAAGLAGAPVPGHVLEALRRGRAADGSRAGAVLGVAPAHDALAVLAGLYEWAPVTSLPAREPAA